VRSGLLRPQSRLGHRSGGAAPRPTRARRTHRHRAWTDGRRHARARHDRLLEGRFDVLVCTTIVESGIDLPSVNTLIVDRAERLGLGQLHQLRGRSGEVDNGRTPTSFTGDQVLSETAYERLRTIGDNTALGSGSRSPCATSRSAVPGTSSATTSPVPSRPWVTTSTCTRRRSRRRRQGLRRARSRPGDARRSGEAICLRTTWKRTTPVSEGLSATGRRHLDRRVGRPARRMARPLRCPTGTGDGPAGTE